MCARSPLKIYRYTIFPEKVSFVFMVKFLRISTVRTCVLGQSESVQSLAGGASVDFVCTRTHLRQAPPFSDDDDLIPPRASQSLIKTDVTKCGYRTRTEISPIKSKTNRPKLKVVFYFKTRNICGRELRLQHCNYRRKATHPVPVPKSEAIVVFLQ